MSGSRHEAPPPPIFWERLTTGPQHAHVPRAGRGATWTHSVVSTRKTRWYHTYAECVHLDLQVSNGPENHHVGGRLWLRRLGTEGVLRASRLEGSSLRPAGASKGLRLRGPPKDGVGPGWDGAFGPDRGRSDDLRDLRLNLESHRTASPAGAPRGTREGHREHEGRVRAGGSGRERGPLSSPEGMARLEQLNGGCRMGEALPSPRTRRPTPGTHPSPTPRSPRPAVMGWSLSLPREGAHRPPGGERFTSQETAFPPRAANAMS